jgi:hypothetical protein
MSLRWKALKKAIKKYGYSSTMKKVNLLYIYNKNKKDSLILKKLIRDKANLKKYKEKN